MKFGVIERDKARLYLASDYAFVTGCRRQERNVRRVDAENLATARASWLASRVRACM